MFLTRLRIAMAIALVALLVAVVVGSFGARTLLLRSAHTDDAATEAGREGKSNSVTEARATKQAPKDRESTGDKDLTDHGIRLEPHYHGTSPRYCLLVFGPGAHVWLVIAGRTLYVDRNGNGDLSKPADSVQPTNDSEHDYRFGPIDLHLNESHYTLEMVLYKELFGKHSPDIPQITVTDVAKQRTYGAWGDQSGFLTFASRAKDAPVLYFGGPLQMGFEVAQPLVKKSTNTYELNVGVGTYGRGKGSFVHLKYWNGSIPERARPTIVLEFPNKNPGQQPVRIEAVLKERC